MAIRKATAADAQGIAQLANSLRLDLSKEQPAGFLAYPLTPPEYALRIEKLGTSVYVAVDEVGALEGFLSAYGNNATAILQREGAFEHMGELGGFINNRDPRFVFCDQIAIRQGMNRKRIGSGLMNELFKHMHEEDIPNAYAFIMDSPRPNLASRLFAESLGFNEMGYLLQGSNIATPGDLKTSFWKPYQLTLRK